MKAKKLITSESVGIIFAYRFIFRQKKNEFEHIWEYDGTKDELFSLCFDVK